MKKITAIILIVLILIGGLFILTGCGNNENGGIVESNKLSNNNSSKSVTNEFSIGDKNFKFDKETTFNDFSYKNANGLELDESKMAVYLDYKNNDIYDGKYVFRIAMLYKENMSLDDVADQYEGKSYESKRINEFNWITYESNNNNIDTIVYMTEKNNNLYIVNIGKYENCNIDINALAEVFMNGVTIK